MLQSASMSALGHKRRFALQWAMSALPPKADICSALAHVGFGPIADIGSLDDYIDALQKSVRNTQVQRLCGLEIEGKLELRGLLYGQVFRLRLFRFVVVM